MDESNGSRGLKIAVSAFLSISVMLGVTVYFLYANHAMTQAKLAAANERIRQLEQSNRQALTKYEEMKKAIGAGKSEAGATKGDGTDAAGHRPG